MLRMEREENQEVKLEKPTVEDPTRRARKLENKLRKASGQMGRGNLIVRRLEVENAEIRAETEALKLSASESLTICLAVAKREKKYLKKVLAWEKQRVKLQEDITAEKHKLIELQEERLQVEAATKTAEAEEQALMFQHFAVSGDNGEFELRIRPHIDQVLLYEDEDPHRQEATRKTVPVENLEEKALVALAKHLQFHRNGHQ